MNKSKPKPKSKLKSKPKPKSRPVAAKVKPIPDGYHSITPYLTIRGASAALDFYKAVC